MGERVVGVAIGTKAAAGDVHNSEAAAAKTSDALVELRIMICEDVRRPMQCRRYRKVELKAC